MRHCFYNQIFSVFLIGCIILFGMILGACDHIDLDYPTGGAAPVKVKVAFHWDDDPDASPDGMVVYFFRLDTKGSRATKAAPATFEFKGRDGGGLLLVPGRYAAICHNNDSDRHGYVGYNEYSDFGLRLTNLRDGEGFNFRSAAASGFGEERFATSPDAIWISSLETIEIRETPGGEVQVVDFDMQSVINTYTFIIHNPINFSNSMSIKAAVSGMAGTIHPGLRLTGEETVTHTFSMAPLAGGGLIGRLLTFGHCARSPIGSRNGSINVADHHLVVSAVMPDGKSWYSAHNVTEQIHQSKIADVVVELDSVVFPKPVEEDGWLPTIVDWEGKTEFVGM